MSRWFKTLFLAVWSSGVVWHFVLLNNTYAVQHSFRMFGKILLDLEGVHQQVSNAGYELEVYVSQL